MANLLALDTGRLMALIGKLAKAEFTVEMAEAILDRDNPNLARVPVEALRAVLDAANANLLKMTVPEQGGHPYRGGSPMATPTNPFTQTISEQIEALKRANQEEGWNIPVETFARLAETAPEWPEGRDSYRSFRIRFGEGDKGVAKTFEAHAARIKRIFGEDKFYRWDYLRSDKKHLRLLAGNATHKPVVEWTIAHLDANRKRSGISAVRGPKSLADEGLVMAWLFPKRVHAIDYKEWCAWFCAGYELHVPERGGGSWQRVPYVNRNLDTGRVDLRADWHSDDYSEYSVPALRE